MYDIDPGCMFTVFPGPKQFNYGALWGGQWEEYYVCITGPALKRLIAADWFPTTAAASTRSAISHSIVALYQELIGTLGAAQPGDAERASLIAERLLLEMFHRRASTRTAQTAGKPVDAVLSYRQAWCAPCRADRF